MAKQRLTHLDSQGTARMVDVGHKPISAREAIAEGYIEMKGATLRAIVDGTVPKGEVLATARLAGIMAAKRCGELIPLCHPLPIESVTVDFELLDDRIRIQSTARITAKTGFHFDARFRGDAGVEMEALTAVSVAALT